MADAELSRFIKYLSVSKRKPAAVTYKSVLTSFISWLGERDKTLSMFTIADVDEYYRNIENNHTANMFLGALKSFSKYKYASLPFGDPTATLESQRIQQLGQLKSRPKRGKRGKVALTPSEVGELLHLVKKRRNSDVLYAGTTLAFYFGARPIELELYMRASHTDHPAIYNWKNNTMQLWTAKVHFPRFLAWNPKLTPLIKTWCAALPKFTNPGEWLTTHLHDYEINGVKITSRVARKTVQTNFRINGIEDYITDAVLGHVSQSPMGDTYMDFTQMEGRIKDVFVNKHYMIANGVI